MQIYVQSNYRFLPLSQRREFLNVFNLSGFFTEADVFLRLCCSTIQIYVTTADRTIFNGPIAKQT